MDGYSEEAHLLWLLWRLLYVYHHADKEVEVPLDQWIGKQVVKYWTTEVSCVF